MDADVKEEGTDDDEDGSEGDGERSGENKKQSWPSYFSVFEFQRADGVERMFVFSQDANL